MDIILNKQWIDRSGYEPKQYRSARGTSGLLWIYNTSSGAAHFIHHSAYSRDNELKYCGFRGYGGRTLMFHLEDGTIQELEAPWHSNAESLFKDTGIDIRSKYITFVIIAQSRRWVPSTGVCILQDVIYQDEQPQEGDFYRGEVLAMQISRCLARDLVLYKESIGGSSNGTVYQDQLDIHGKRPRP